MFQFRVILGLKVQLDDLVNRFGETHQIFIRFSFMYLNNLSLLVCPQGEIGFKGEKVRFSKTF